ncbi:family 78 glycoside hydrolase catalytic domain [Rhodopirellula sallentina]|nr:family 78 glycoside hydrolase catalytic domain [Rhodopirellula sallentina]
MNSNEMFHSIRLAVTGVLLLAGTVSVARSEQPKPDVQLVNLRCEYRENPIGIDVLKPRLSWMASSEQRGVRQTAYRIQVASSSERLGSGEGDLWDTGKVSSERSTHIRYAGGKLAARQTCFWRVRVWDQNDQPCDWSPVAKWEIGLPEKSDWRGAQWIRLDTDLRKSSLAARPVQTKKMAVPDYSKTHPAPLFRNEMLVKSGLVRARAYVCGLGYSELTVNGKPTAGDAVLSPGQTTYDVRALYTTRDITGLLQEGSNAIGVMMGNGFFGQDQAFHAPKLGYGEPALLAKIVLDYADGSTEAIGTNSTWKSSTGPVVYDNVYGGETYDARLEHIGWNRPGFDDSQWRDAVTVTAPTQSVNAQMVPEIRRMETLPCQEIREGENGKWIFDIGRNIAGWARIQISAPAGTVISMEYAEVLMPDGSRLDTATTGGHATGLQQKDIYVCKGGGMETWEPRFTYHGFRYVEVEGLTERPADDFLAGVLVHTDVPRHGMFECSDALLNRIYQTSLWTIEDNIHSVIEDCPHREKCAWLGDAHAVGETAIYNYDMALFWTKFVDDIETVLGRGGVTYWGQRATPGIPCNIAVGRRLCQEARPDWGAAYILLPWCLFNYYGDTDVFTRHYDHLARWISYVNGLSEEGIVVRGYGDWCPPGGNKTMECPPNLTSTAFFYGTVRIMERFAEELGKTDDAEQYKRLAARVREAFNREFFDPETGGYGSQTADSVALRFGLASPDTAGQVGNSLRAGVVEQHQGHASVGIHGGRSLYTELCESGSEDVAFAAIRKETFPGYGYMLKKGFTTWPEVPLKYDAGKPFAHHSLNHPMQSGFAVWFHECVGGIQPASPGFKKIKLKPYGYTQLEWAKAHYESPFGKITSDWKVDANTFQWTVTIPPNTSAIVHVPTDKPEDVFEGMGTARNRNGVEAMGTKDGRALFQIGSGTYIFSSNLGT